MPKKKKNSENVGAAPVDAVIGVAGWGWHAIGQVLRFIVTACRRILGWSWRFVKWSWHWTIAAGRTVLNWGLWGLKGVWWGTMAVLHWAMAAAGWGFAFILRWFLGIEPYHRQPEYDVNGSPIYEAIRHRVGRRYRRRGRFALLSFLFLFILAGTWLDAVRYIDPTPRALPLTIMMGAILMIHFINLLVGEAEDRAVEREVSTQGWQRVPAADGMYGERLVRLSDDGELVDVVFDDERGVVERRK